MNDTSPKPTKHAPFHLGALRFSMAQFLIALVLLLVSAPFVLETEYGRIVETGLVTLVLLSAVLAVGASRRTLVWALVLVIPALTGKWAHDLLSARLFPGSGMIPAAVFFVFVIAQLLRFILRAPRVTSEVLHAGIALYLMLGLLWSSLYLLVYRMVPNAFTFTVGTPSAQTMEGFNSLYFSFVTLSTVGYGDIVPIAPVARLLAIVEATAGILYMTVLISRLVSLYTSEQANPQPEKPHE